MFLTLYTPAFRRPRLLRTMLDSVQAQTCRDFEHLVYVDNAGDGIPGMYARLVRYSSLFEGDYVYFLQDDDRLADPRVIADLKAFAQANRYPSVIVARNHKAQFNLPGVWQAEPVCGKVDFGGVLVRRDVFLEHRQALLSGRYEADFEFIHAIWAAGEPFAWCDRLIAESNQLGHGRPEGR